MPNVHDKTHYESFFVDSGHLHKTDTIKASAATCLLYLHGSSTGLSGGASPVFVGVLLGDCNSQFAESFPRNSWRQGWA